MADADSKLTAYEIKDGAYGMYLAKDGFEVDVNFDFVYPKEQVDGHIKSMEKRIKKINKHLRDLRRKYKTLQPLLNRRCNYCYALKPQNDNGLKCFGMCCLNKGCPEKKSVIELVKEWK